MTEEIKKIEEKIEENVKKEKVSKPSEEIREYIIPLRRKIIRTPRYKKTNKAIKSIKEFLARHMKIRDRNLNKIKIDKYLNEFMWSRGIKNPPIKVKVKAFIEGDVVRVELAELPEKLKFKKLRLEKRSAKATDLGEKKAKVPEEKKEKPEESKEEDEKKKDAEEKKAAVVEAGEKMAKDTAKASKHQTKFSKQPKRQQRKALAK